MPTGIIREWIGEVAHTDLTREMIRDWHTANGHRRSQANEIVSRLKRIWEWCEGEDDILSAGAPTRAKLFAKLREMRYH